MKTDQLFIVCCLLIRGGVHDNKYYNNTHNTIKAVITQITRMALWFIVSHALRNERSLMTAYMIPYHPRSEGRRMRALRTYFRGGGGYC